MQAQSQGLSSILGLPLNFPPSHFRLLVVQVRRPQPQLLALFISNAPSLLREEVSPGRLLSDPLLLPP